MKKSFIIYAVAYLALLAYACWLLYSYPKLELHLMLNSHHTAFQDVFFKYYSKLAEWPLYLLALVPLLLKLKRIVIFFFICEISSAIFVQILKHIFDADRPARAFEHFQGAVLPVVQGVHLHHSHSFPSGHSSTFFVFFTCCALILASYFHRSGRHGYKARLLTAAAMLLLLSLAAVGGYSRIYLSQHFLSDVCMGSIIGFSVPCLLYYFCGNRLLKPKSGLI